MKLAQSLVITLVFVLAIGVGIYSWVASLIQDEPVEIIETPIDIPEELATTPSIKVIGTSVQNRDIESYVFGSGETNLLFIGGIHGGYEWNTILLAYEIIEYFQDNPTLIPENLSVHIIPNLNPDGLFEATSQEGRFFAEDIPNVDIHTAGIGRFNANGVDLNRNFNCRWSPEGVWRGQSVGTGEGPFSEPEAQLIRDYIIEINPAAGVVWHSRANTVYGSECGEPVAAETLALMSAYAQAADYGEVPVFDAYPVTGAIEDWMAALGIPTVSVELETRTSSEFGRNLAGTLATFELYTK